MIQATDMIPYIRLYTTDLHPMDMLPTWLQTVMGIAAFLALTVPSSYAITLTVIRHVQKQEHVYNPEEPKPGWTKSPGFAWAATVVGIIIFAICITPAVQYRSIPGRTGSKTADNVTLIEQSYNIRDIQPVHEEHESLDDFMRTWVNKGSRRYEATAKSETGDGLLHITLQKEPDDRLRVYEKIGDSQHLITPARMNTATETRG